MHLKVVEFMFLNDIHYRLDCQPLVSSAAYALEFDMATLADQHFVHRMFASGISINYLQNSCLDEKLDHIIYR